jgi:hypothetical protein
MNAPAPPRGPSSRVPLFEPAPGCARSATSIIRDRLAQSFHRKLDICRLQMAPAFDLGLISILLPLERQTIDIARTLISFFEVKTSISLTVALEGPKSIPHCQGSRKCSSSWLCLLLSSRRWEPPSSRFTNGARTSYTAHISRETAGNQMTGGRLS